jgi:hypothetical protein
VKIVEQKSKDDVISSFELQLKALAQKLAELERRLAVLERSLPTSKPGTPKLIPSKPMPSLRGRSYIERAIDAARRDYEREHGK